MCSRNMPRREHLGQEAFEEDVRRHEDGDDLSPPHNGRRTNDESHCRRHFDVPKGCENSVHPMTNDESARRVATDAISL
jgi:hypothetical protein